MPIYTLVIQNERVEESTEVFVRNFSTLEKAKAVQADLVELEKRERADEELTVDEYLDIMEVNVHDENGGTVAFSIIETELE